MRVTENRLRSIIRSVISENMSNEYVPPGSYGEVEERQMTFKEMEDMFRHHSENEQDHLDGYDELIVLQKNYENDLKAFVNDLIDRYGRNYGKKQRNDVR